MNNTFDDDELYLEHHGIKGQAWGVRNGPPYPLNSVGKEAFSKIKKVLSNEVRSNRSRKISAKNFNTKLLKAKSANNTADANYIRSKIKKQEAENEYNKARHRGKIDREQEKLDKERMTTERAKLQGERLQEYQNTIKALNPNIKGPTQALKDRIINSGDKKLLKKYGYLLNNEEYAQAITRLTLAKDVRTSRFKDNSKKIKEGVQDVRTTANDLVDVYNMGANAYNAFQTDENAKLPGISKEVKKKQSEEEKLREHSAATRSAYVRNVSDRVSNGTATDDEIRSMNDILGISNPQKRSAKDRFADKLFNKATDEAGNIDFARLSEEESAALRAILGVKNVSTS